MVVSQSSAYSITSAFGSTVAPASLTWFRLTVAPLRRAFSTAIRFAIEYVRGHALTVLGIRSRDCAKLGGNRLVVVWTIMFVPPSVRPTSLPGGEDDATG